MSKKPDKLKSYKVGDEVELEVYAEGCCEVCNEIVHNHIDCPICNRKDVETDRFHNLEEDDDKEIQCGKCGSVFEKISDNWYYDCKVKIIAIRPYLNNGGERIDSR